MAFSATTFRQEDTDFQVPGTPNIVFEGFFGLTAERTGTLPSSPGTSEIVIFKSLDLSLGTYDFIIDGNGHDIDGSPTYTMTNLAEGPRGAIGVYWDGTTWSIF
jgi:hypothetical protein